MKTKVYDNSLSPFPLFPSTTDINYNQSKIARENGYPLDEIFVVISGSGILEIEGSIYTLEKNDMFYLRANTPHAYHCTGDSFVTSYLSYFGSGVSAVREYYSLGNFEIFKNKSTGAFEAAATKLYEDFDSVQEQSTLSKMAYSAVITFFDEACRKEHSPLETVYNFLESNFSKPVTLNDIASLYPYSKTKLCCDFKKKYSVTLFEALTLIRLRHAENMLYTNGHLGLKIIASSCGFNDVSYFCKIYKKRYGHTPKSIHKKKIKI